MLSFQPVLRRREVLCMLLLAALFGVIGCGGRPKGTVSGKVAFHDQPVTAMNINIYPKGRGLGDGTSLSRSGTFAFPDALDVGTYAVYFSELPHVTLPRREEAKAAKRLSIPTKYFDLNSSGLSFEVKPGKNEFVVELQDNAGDSSSGKANK